MKLGIRRLNKKLGKSILKFFISAKIKPKSERTRLNDLMDSIVSSIQLPDSLSGNFILRSAAEGIKESQPQGSKERRLHLP